MTDCEGGTGVTFMGRPPKPTAVRELEGNRGKRPLPAGEPQPESGTPAPPEWLPAVALEEWHRLTPQLERMGVLTVADRNALAAYCVAYATVVAATAELEESGLLVEGQKGNVVRSPAVQVQRDALEQMARWGAKFGLSPSDRARLQVPEEHGEDADVLRLLSGGTS